MKTSLITTKVKIAVGLLCLCSMAMLVASASANVVISEIMYHPPQLLDDQYEFLELYNTGSSAVNLQNWVIDGIGFTFSAGASIGPNAYLVLAKDPNAFRATYGFQANYIYTGKLSNSGELLKILDANGIVMDEVAYTTVPPWPVTPDELGPSLERIDPTLNGNTPRNWRASIAPAGHTAGAINSVNAVGLPPWISNVQNSTVQPGTPITVTASVQDATTVNLKYIINFTTPVIIPMRDDGLSGDGAAGDGVYGAIIPAQSVSTLIRYRLDTTGPTGAMGFPRTDDSVNYTGTFIEDTPPLTGLPVLHWLIDPNDYNTAVANALTDACEPALLYYNGTLYDNMQTRVRGGSSRNYVKKNWKFYTARNHDFFMPGFTGIPVDNIDLQANFTDKSYMRQYLSYHLFEDIGHPTSQTFPVRLYQNGQFFGLYLYLEHPEKNYLTRNGLDADTGSMYEATPGDQSDCGYHPLAEMPNWYEKHRVDDGDFNDIYNFLNGINNLTGQARRNFIFDNVDIPRMMNYWAASIIMHNNDNVAKNYYLYRDNAGTQRWYMVPWDWDLTWGRNWYSSGGVLNDAIWADKDSLDSSYISGSGSASVVSPSHPLYGNQAHQKCDHLWNRLIDALLNEPDIRGMYLRRLRTEMDEQLQSPGTPYAQLKLEKRIDEQVALMDTEAAMDYAKWGSYGQIQTIAQGAQVLKDSYLAVRRTHLFNTHSVDVNVNGEIPHAQTTKPPIVINEIMYNPAGGDDDEFIELYNLSATEYVDMSGWQLSGVELTIPPGTVLPPQDYLVVVKNDVQFRTTYGSGIFVAGEYEGSLDSAGENLVLTDRQGNVIDQVQYSNGGFWPVLSGGQSIELIDASQNNNHPMNWEASALAGGTPGAINSMAGTFPYIPELKVNEVLSVNTSINTDEMGEYAPWIEIYNDSNNAVDLGGMFLTDDYNNPTKWAIPANTVLNSSQWMIFWADAEANEGPLHTNFALNSAGGFVGLYTATGDNIVDYMDYGALAANISYGKYPDGVASFREFATPTPAAENYIAPVPLILNEYTGVADTKFLKDNGSDTYWGRVLGNGGDWFELVVTRDHLDIRGWNLIVTDNGISKTLTLTNNNLWADLRAGTIITVSENLLDNISNYDPPNGKWWINVQAKTGASGTYITATNFDVSQTNSQITIRDSNGTRVFGPAGEGIKPASGIGNDEIFHLEEDPGALITERSNYTDGSTSTFGAPNIYTSGKVQDFSKLRVIPDTGAPTPNPMTWANVPTTTGTTSITMKATTASDSSGVEYYFECTAGGGHNSGWQNSPYYKDKGLLPNTIYTYRVKARDKSANQNETAWSSVGSAGTLPAVGIIGSWVTGTTHAKETGTNRALVFIAHAKGNSSSSNLTAVTYGGKTMTKIINKLTGSSSSRAYVAAFILNDTNIEAATSTTFTPTWTSQPSNITYSSVFLKNVNQTTLVGATASAGSTSSTTVSTSALTTSDGDMVLESAASSATGTYTVTTGWTKDLDLSVSGYDGMGGHKAATGASETPSITQSSGNHSLIGFVVKIIPLQATNPSPANAAINVNLTPTLSWTAGIGATSHDVYFGAFNPGTFQGNQTATTFSPGTLLPNTTYYWRIDEKNASGTTKGTVWSFTTVPPPPSQATNPIPASGATYVGATTDISWTAGSGTTSHDVYFGTTNPPTFRVNQTGTTYDTGTMSYNTTYYWRIDEKNAGVTTTGAVWSFTTVPVPPAVSIIGSWVTGTTHAKESGTNRALVFIAHAEHSGSVTLNSVTYGGRSMTKVVERIISSGTTRTYVAAFILNDAGITAATTTTFTPTWSATPTSSAYSSVFLQNVNQSTLTGVTATNATSSGATITTSALANSRGDMIIDAATCSSTGSYTVNNGFTEALELSITNADAVDGYKAATGASETPSVTHSTSSSRQSLIGFVVKVIPPGKATNPTPANSAINVAVTTDLSWIPSAGATSHDVYFGTTSPGTFRGNQTTGVTFDTGTMANNTTYYWRIDEKNAGGTTTGDVWSFTTIVDAPAKATNPGPADSTTNVGVTTDLSWTAGARATSHDVYFGTTNPPPSQGNQTGTTYDTGTMVNGTTYYWRIDEKNVGGTTTGDVWNFTTIAKQTLTSSSSTGGDVTTPGEGDFQYDNGTNASIVATADAHYHFVNWTGTAVTAGKVNNPNAASTTVLMDADYTVIANFAIDQQSLTTSTTVGGTVTTPGIGTYWYNYGANTNIVASAATGYHFVNWTGTAVTAGKVANPNAATTIVLMDANYAVQANFGINQYTITASAGANGSIDPVGDITKDYGSSQCFTATPSTGYEIDAWYLDGNIVQTGGGYCLNNITANHTVSVTFKILTYTVTASAGANGSVDPLSAVVNYNGSQLFTATPDTGYEVDKWTVDGGDVQTGGTTYTLSNITANHTVAVSFKILIYTVSVSAGANGGIDPVGDITKDYGSSQLFNAIPDSGYAVDKWIVDDTEVQSGGDTYTLADIMANHTVNVTFTMP